MARKLTVADIIAVTGYNRDQVRGLLDSLPRYANAPSSSRRAQEFTPRDLLAISVGVCLENTHRLQRSAIAKVIDAIHDGLNRPRSLNLVPLLHISFDPPTAIYLADQQVSRPGTTVALGPIFEKFDTYMGIELPQKDMFPVAPTIVNQRGQR